MLVAIRYAWMGFKVGMVRIPMDTLLRDAMVLLGNSTTVLRTYLLPVLPTMDVLEAVVVRHELGTSLPILPTIHASTYTTTT